MHYFPGGFLRLRCDEESEIIGIDDAEMGEFAYDYVSLEAELGPASLHDGNIDNINVNNGSNTKLQVDPHVRYSSEESTQQEKEIEEAAAIRNSPA